MDDVGALNIEKDLQRLCNNERELIHGYVLDLHRQGTEGKRTVRMQGQDAVVTGRLLPPQGVALTMPDAEGSVGYTIAKQGLEIEISRYDQHGQVQITHHIQNDLEGYTELREIRLLLFRYSDADVEG